MGESLPNIPVAEVQANRIGGGSSVWTGGGEKQEKNRRSLKIEGLEDFATIRKVQSGKNQP